MKKRFLQLSGILLSAVFLTAFTACGNEELYAYTSSNPDHFNGALAQWAFTKQSDEIDKATWAQISDLMTNVEQTVSVSEEESSITKFNAAAAGAEVELDETAYNLLVLAKELYEKTEGAYNPAVGNLVDLWGFSPRFSKGYTPTYAYDRALQKVDPENEKSALYLPLPEEKYIEAFRSITDFSKVELSEREGKFYALKPDCSVTMEEVTYTMQINLGGIGKGYAVDEAEKIIRAAGYENGYFSLGGSSMSVFKHPAEGAWTIGVINPRRELYAGTDFMAVVETDVCLSSSGDYVQFYSVDGKRYSHIINPETGYPVNAAPSDTAGGIICASVFGLSAAEGDATTTAIMVMGKDRAIEYIGQKLSGVHACFVYENADGTFTLYTNMEEGEYTLYADMETVKI